MDLNQFIELDEIERNLDNDDFMRENLEEQKIAGK